MCWWDVKPYSTILDAFGTVVPSDARPEVQLQLVVEATISSVCVFVCR